MNTTYFSTTTTTTTVYRTQNDLNTPPISIPIPVTSPSSPPTPIPIPVRLPATAAAAKIQAAYRAHRVRSLLRQILTVDADTNVAEREIQRQDTVDAVRRDERERLRVGERLMALLLRLDSVPGIDPAVRDLRRRVSRRVVGLQEVLDAVVAAPEVGTGWEAEGEVVAVEAAAQGAGFGCFERFLMGF